MIHLHKLSRTARVLVHRLWQIIGVNVSTGIVEKYVSKFHGKTLREDMALAGMSDIDSYVLRGEGLMFNIAKKDKGKWKCDLVTWDGNLIKDKTVYTGDTPAVYDLQ